MTPRLSRITAVTLGTALILVSPGPSCYHAFAQVRNAPAGTVWSAPGAPAATAAAGTAMGVAPAQAAALTIRPGVVASPVITPMRLPASAKSVAPAKGEALPAPLTRSALATPAAPRGNVPAAGLAEPLEPKRIGLATRGPLAPPVATGAPEAGEAQALGRRIDLHSQLEGFYRLGRGASAEDLPVEGSDGKAKPNEGLKPADAPKAEGEAASTPAPGAPAPEAPQTGPVKLPRSLWGLFWGHSVATIFGINFHMLSQPYLVTQTLGKSKALMGLVRNVHMGSMSFVNLLPIGWLIDKVNLKVIYVGTSVFRTLLMGAIPMLFLAGHLTFAVLVGIVALNPLFQSTMIVADAAGRKAFLGTDRKLNKEAAAILGKYGSITGMVFPILAGLVVGALVGAFGLGGYALAYGIYALMVAASIPIYLTMVEDPRDPKTLAVNTIGEAVALIPTGMAALARLTFVTGPRAAWRWLRAGGWKTLLFAPFKALKAVFWDFPRGVIHAIRNRGSSAEVGGEKVTIKEALARKLDQYEAFKGLAYILRNKTLSVLMMVGAIEAFLADAMPMVVLPNFILDAIGENTGKVPLELGYALGAVAAVFVARLGFAAVQRARGKKTSDIAQMVEWGVLAATLGLLAWKLPIMLAAAGGIFSVMLAAQYFGRLIASKRMEGDAGDKLIERHGHGILYRVAAIGSLLFWLMWLFPAIIAPGHFWINLGVVLAVEFGMSLLHTPVGIAMAPVVREQIPDKILGRVDSAFNMIDLIFMAGGALIAGLIVDKLAITTAMFIIALMITGTAVLEWMVPKWIFPDGKHPPPPVDPNKTVWAAPAAPALAFA
ncbi:MAG: hypothetical protein HY553_13865 [Elusimicrobia bacterium]|nr:hypothetical protein [Elusimicrobiota bacterium]